MTNVAMPQILALRPRFVAELPLFDIKLLDKLEDYTLAATHAHTQYLGADTPAEAIPELSEDAVKTRELLLSDASALAKRGYLSEGKLLELKGTNGYRNTASDVLTLAGILRDNWPKISGKTCVSLEELDAAESLGYRLLNALGFREQGPATVASVAQARQRSYTLFANAYDVPETTAPAAVSAAPPTASPVVAAAATVPVGLPGSDPFIH